MSDNSNTETPLTTYTVTHSIPPCEVNNDLLNEIEDYILEKVSVYDKNARDDYDVQIIDRFGRESLDSIKQNKNPFFPDNVFMIRLEYGRFTRNHVIVSFATYSKGNKIDVSIKSKAPRREVEGYIAEFMQILQDKKTSRFYNPPLKLNIFIFLFSVFYLGLILPRDLFVIYLPPYIHTVITILILSLSVYSLFTLLTPYVIFNTRKNQKLEKWRSWIVFTILEFVFLTLLGGYLLSKIIG